MEEDIDRESGAGRALHAGQIHLWVIPLTGPAPEADASLRVLSADEQMRARRFRPPRARARFIHARAALRWILSGYVREHPARLGFEYGARGKPRLTGKPGRPDIRFNLSHSGDLGLLAVGLGGELGVDLEYWRRPVRALDIGRRFFSALEYRQLARLPEAQQREAFYLCWTRKESYVKATGEGMGHPLRQFDVELRPGHPAVILGTRPDPSEAERWTMYGLDIHPDYKAALVVDGGMDTLAVMRYQGQP